MAAETHSEVTESVISEIGSVTFDRRLDNCSVMNSPRATTPVSGNSAYPDDDGEHARNKRMRFQVN